MANSNKKNIINKIKTIRVLSIAARASMRLIASNPATRIRKTMMVRGLELELNGTMYENYVEVLEKIKDQSSRVSYSFIQNEAEHFYRPLLDIFLSQDGNYI